MLDKEDQIMYPNKELDKSDSLREQIEVQTEEMFWPDEDDWAGPGPLCHIVS